MKYQYSIFQMQELLGTTRNNENLRVQKARLDFQQAFRSTKHKRSHKYL